MNSINTILVTGGAGYIGSHTNVELLNAGYQVIVLDNLSNSRFTAIQRVEQITGRPITFVQADLRDMQATQAVFDRHDIDAVIHFAGLKAVGESVHIPIPYYQNNIGGTLNLLQAMNNAGVKNLVFSSSATVYGEPASLPITESFPVSATNPYGRSKLIIEEMLADIYRSDSRWNIARLRYFNPVGAHESGLIGESPSDIPNNLVPYISQVAVGRLEKLAVFGNDYPTPDGTGVRDYIHVVDLAIGHIKALEKLVQNPGLVTYNLGTGRGYSVLEMLSVFEKASGRPIAYEIQARRAGDIATCYADPGLAARELGWRATRGIEEMCTDTWRWQQQNPKGYETD